MTSSTTATLKPEYGPETDSVLADAKKVRTSMRGQALLQWGFDRGSANHSIQMPEAVVDQILAWRDEAQTTGRRN
jgi:hypothetical protein